MTCFRTVLLLCLVGISAAHAQSIGFSISDQSSNPSSDQLTVTVVDDETQAPIPNATVSVTDAIGFGRVTGAREARIRDLVHRGADDSPNLAGTQGH